MRQIALVFVGALSACGAGNAVETVDYLIGPDATISDAQAAYFEITSSALAISNAEGLTAFDQIPTQGSATYVGTIQGFGIGSGHNGPDTTYFADLVVTADFENITSESLSINGYATNFVTTLEGFNNPDGTLSLVNGIAESASLGTAVEFDLEGTLVQGDVSVDVFIATEIGNFYGDSAQAAFGQTRSEFVWVTGPDAGTTSGPSGDWFVLRQ